MLRGFYRPELDVLRFLAFLLVYFSHAFPDPAIWAHLPYPLNDFLAGLSLGGGYGVDLFFALSSWLITTLLIREHRELGGIDIKAFYVRRILRIWPLYFVFLLILRPLPSLALPLDGMTNAYSAAFLLLAGNWACAIWGYPRSIAAPLWSISIEEQFYLAWPFVVRRWLHCLPRVLWGLIALSFFTRLFLIMMDVRHPGIWCNTFARLDPIAGGALVAFQRKGEAPRLNRSVRFTLMAAGFIMISAIGLYGSYVGVGAVLSYPMAALASVMIIAGALSPLGVQRAGPLAYLGRISYGLYVFHVALLRLTDGLSPLVHAFGALCGTIVTAAVSYRFLESPFLRLKERFTPLKSAPGLNL